MRAAAHAEELVARAQRPGGSARVLEQAVRRRAADARRSRAPRRRASRRWAATARPRTSWRDSLEREWDPELVAALRRMPDARIRRSSSTRPSAGSRTHDHDALLLRALGTLCVRAQLWGKAQTYLEASLALDDAYETRVALGELFARARPQRRGQHAARGGAQARAGGAARPGIALAASRSPARGEAVGEKLHRTAARAFR